MTNLLREVRDIAVDGDAPLANLLRKCALLGDKLGNDDLRDWAFRELGGYDSEDGVPKYREMTSMLRGDLVIAEVMTRQNVDIPTICLPEGLRDQARTIVLTQGVASLENLLEGEGDTIEFPWDGNRIALVHLEGRFAEGQALLAARQIISKSSIVGALDAIRNHVLEFCIRLGRERPELMASETTLPAPSADDSAAATQTFNNVFIGSQVGNVANASPSAQQTAQITATHGDMTGLMKTLIGAGVPAPEAEALKTAIGQESGQAAKQKCDSWLKRAEQAVTSGAWSLAKGVTTDTLRKAVLAYLGLG